MTIELINSVEVVSEQLVVATDPTENTGLLPLDLEATNNVVAQVSSHVTSVRVALFFPLLYRS